MPDNQREIMVNSRTLSQWLHEGTATLIDVRERHEFVEERIPGSTLHPLSEFDPYSVPRDEEKHLVFHCAAGVRCGKAAEIIRLNGMHGPVHRLEGGLKAWKENGGLTEPGNN